MLVYIAFIVFGVHKNKQNWITILPARGETLIRYGKPFLIPKYQSYDDADMMWTHNSG